MATNPSGHLGALRQGRSATNRVQSRAAWAEPAPMALANQASSGGRPRSRGLTHVDEQGRVRMVDVGQKPVTMREAVARGTISLSASARRAVQSGQVKKGDPLQTARIAGIMAAKRTSELIPLCHPLPLTSVAVDLTPTRTGYTIEARVRTTGQTGVEMEALTAVSVAALTVYDMLKAIDHEMVISDICLIEKRGGASGEFKRHT